ncbi:hypothetical protein [Acrocarpospora macrocephala]|uniref:hypothetical protein n=1 Tax=Acrocarpospora macrocephala TaxID=150177 RepID=UPI0012D2E2F4|nr:hypothetical protein [Acrocarpospora macrocephala]
MQLDGSAAGLSHLVDPSVTRSAVKIDGPRSEAKRPKTALPLEGRFDPVPVAVRVDTSKWETAAPDGEWFATEGAHADRWGEILNGDDSTRSLADQLHHHEGKLDGIGPAYYADAEQLEQINQEMSGINVWP